MPINYTINTKEGIIYETWSEAVTLEEFKQTKEKEFSDPDFNPSFHVFSDLRLNNQEFDESIILGIAEYLKLQSDKIDNRKSAITANNPQAVAGSIIFNTNSKNIPLNTRVFTTKEEAIKWLKE